MYRISAVMLVLVALPLLALRAGEFDAEARARTIAPFIDEQTVLIAHVDLTRIGVDAFLDWAIEAGRLEVKEMEEPRREWHGWIADLTKAGGKEIYVVVSLADLPMESPLLVVPLGEGADAPSVRRALMRIPLFRLLSFNEFGKSLVSGSSAAMKRLRNGKPSVRPELSQAFAAAGNTTAQLLLLPTPDTRRVIEELMPALPPQMGGGSTRPLSHGLLWAAAGADLPPKLSLRLQIQSPDAAQAGALNDLLARLMKTAVQQPGARAFLPDVGRLTDIVAFQVEGNRLNISAKDKGLNSILLTLVQSAYQAAQRRAVTDKLKKLAFAMHTYADTTVKDRRGARLPAIANFDKEGKPLLSWRVHLLPFLNEENLYRQFHLDEPWDSRHNRKLLAKMPKIFEGPNRKLNAEGKTIFLLPVGKDAAFKEGPEGPRFPTDFPDGTSNTIFIVEADDAHAVPWTQPEDLKLDPAHPERGLGGHFRQGFLAALADGSVRFVVKTISKRTLQDAFNPKDGRPMGADW